MNIFSRLVSRRTDCTLCMQPSLEKDSEALCKFLQFDTEVNILHRNKAGKAPSSSIVCCSEFVRLQNHVIIANSDGGFAIIRKHRSEVSLIIVSIVSVF